MSHKSRVPGKTVVQLQRVEPAQKRQALREARSNAEQLTELDHRPGQAARERARLAQV